MNVSKQAASVTRRFYAPHWLAFCDVVKIEPQTYGAFNAYHNMFGLQLPSDQYTQQRVAEMCKSLRLVYTTRDNGVNIMCYLHGTRYYRFVFFETSTTVSEDSHENVRKFANA